MQRSQLSEQVVKDVVRHLFDPQSPSRSATRALISPTLILDFPLLPPAHEAAAAVATPASREVVFKRHSPSAQALSLFRLPGFVVNHLPGSQWTLEFDYVRDVSRQDPDVGDNFHLPPGAVRWRALIAWSLTLGSPLHLPLGLEEKLVFHRQDSREVELVFAPSESDADKKLRLAREIKLASEPSGSRPRDSPGDDPDVQLVRVRYTGLRFPPYFNRLPLHSTIANYIPHLFALFLGPLYGILLLLGLDHSTRSLDASRRRRFRLEKKRARLAEKERIRASEGKGKCKESEVGSPKGKGKQRLVEESQKPMSPPPISTLSTRSPITSDSDDGSDLTGGASHDGDGMELESRYHRLMRQGHSTLDTIRDYRHKTTQILAKALEEVGLVRWFIRSAVVVAAEGGLTVAGVGSEMLNEAGLDFGEDPEQSKRMRQMEQARQGIHRRSRTLSKHEPAPVADEPPSDSTWTNRSSPGKKRVSFSLRKPIDSSSLFDAPRSSLGPGDPPTPDSAFTMFRTELDQGSSAAISTARVGEGQLDDERYSQDFGLPRVVTHSPLVPDFSQAAHDAAVAAKARRRSLNEAYSPEKQASKEIGSSAYLRGVKIHKDAASEYNKKRTSLDSTYSEGNFPLFGDAPRIQTDSPAPQEGADSSTGKQSSHEHIDTPIPTPVDDSPVSAFRVPDSITAEEAQEGRAGRPDVEGGSTRYSSLTLSRSPLATSMISPPSAARPLAIPALASTPIAETGDEAQEEGTTSSLGVLFGPKGSTEHVKSAEEAVEQDEMREVDELLGVPSTEEPTASTSTPTSATGDDRTDLPTSTTTAGAEPMSASALAAGAEDFFYSPTLTETPLLSPDTHFSQSLAQDSTARGRQDSATSIPYPRTPSDSPEMERTHSLHGEGWKSAGTGVAQSVLPEEEQVGAASCSAMARSESMASSLGGSSVLGDDEGKESGFKEKKTRKRKGKGGKKGPRKSEIGGA